MTQTNSPAEDKRSGWITLLRIVLVILFLALAVIVGMAVGYTVLGKQELGDVWEWSTWQHVFDLVFSS